VTKEIHGKRIRIVGRTGDLRNASRIAGQRTVLFDACGLYKVSAVVGPLLTIVLNLTIMSLLGAKQKTSCGCFQPTCGSVPSLLPDEQRPWMVKNFLEV